MAFGLLIAALLAPASTPEVHGVCDEPQLADEAREEAPATAATVNNCSEPAAAVPVVECGDPRMTFWVQEIGGACAMPKQLIGAGETRARPKANLCNGLDCGNGQSPIRAARGGGSDGQSAIVASQSIKWIPSVSRFTDGKEAAPAAVPPPRLERPPRS